MAALSFRHRPPRLLFFFKLYVLGIVVIAAQAELVAAVYAAYFLFKRGAVHIVKIKAGYFVCAVRAGKFIRLQRGVKAHGKGDKIARVYFVLVFVPVCCHAVRSPVMIMVKV